MDHYDWLLVLLLLNFLEIRDVCHVPLLLVRGVVIALELVVLLDALQKKCGIETEVEHLLETRDVVVIEWEPRDAAMDALRRILVRRLRAEVVDLDHLTVVLLKESDNVVSTVAVKGFCAFGREPTGNYAIGDVGHVKVEVIKHESCLVSRDELADPVGVAACSLRFNLL